MAPRTTSTSMRGRPLQCDKLRLDPVVPTAVASLDAKRNARDTLRAIDALLALDDTSSVQAEVSVIPHRDYPASSDTPGPGSYDPQKERTQWRRHANVALHRASPAASKKTALARSEHMRAIKTPGPGAYDIATADRVVKLRVPGVDFRSAKTEVHRVPENKIVSPPLEPALADKWLSRYTQPKGAVTYKPVSTTAATTRTQRERLRRIHLEKTRHSKVGFYSVRFGLTERHLGGVGIVAMGKSATKCLDNSARHIQAKAKRHVRAWRAADTTSQQPLAVTAAAPENDTERFSNHKHVVAHTIQWQRARARALLQHRDAKARVDTVKSQPFTSDVGRVTKSLRRDLPAHAMVKHTGRDSVRCPQKNQRIFTHFTSPPQKERRRQASASPSKQPPISLVMVAYDKMLGRDEFSVDANGIYLVGRDHSTTALDSNDPSDHAIRPRVPTVTMRAPSHVPKQPDQSTLLLSPKFNLVHQRTRGHAFLAFENQLDRRERAKLKAFAVDGTPQDRRAVSDVTVTTDEALTFPRRDRGTVNYKTMAGRETERLEYTNDRTTTSDLRDTQSQYPRTKCLVDMAKESARCC